MGFIWNFPLFTIVCSLFSGALCSILSPRAAKRYTILFEGVLILLAACVLGYTLGSGASFTYVMGEFPAPWGNEIRAGVLEALFALVFLVIMLCSVFAGERFLQKDLDESKINLYYSLVNLMTAALMALVWTNDIFTGYVFLEILTLSSCGVLIVREIGRTTLAAMRYMILNLLGSGLYLLGVVLLYDTTGHLLMVPMRTAIADIAADPANLPVLSISVGILTIGLAIKSGLFPFHFWMPDTYGKASPISAALLSSLVSKAYIFLLLKIYYRVIGPEVLEKLPIGNILLVLGMLGIIFGSVSAMLSDDINRMVAFSSAAQIGYIYMGIGIGGLAGYTAALFHMLAHAVTKSQLFLSTPRLAEVSGGNLGFRYLQGSGLRNRDAGKAFSVAALSMIGIPIFAGFASKVLFGISAVMADNTMETVCVLLVLAVSSLLNVLYFIRTMVRIYIAPTKEQVKEGKYDYRVKEGHSPSFFIPMLVLSSINVFMGLFSWIIVDLIRTGLGMFA
ncbi:MAG: sodium:proton antiporter [Blautia sp.]|nr:sodium:proton antiporter [Blautia sp.]